MTTKLRSFLSALVRGRRLDREMEEEWRFHLAERVEALMASGVSRHEAEQVARLEFGDPLRWKEEGREARGLRLIDELRSDVQYALRQMGRTRAATLVIMATLALAIGANTAIFTLFDAVMLKALPVPHPEELKQLVWVARRFGFHTTYNGSARSNAAGERVATSFSHPVIANLRDHATTFSDVFCFDHPQQLSVVHDGTAQLVDGQFVSGNYFRGLRVHAIVGRTLVDDDDKPGAQPVAVISHQFWRRAFAESPDVISRRILVNGAPVAIAGVMPPSFFGVLPGSRLDIVLALAVQSVLDASTPPDALMRADRWGLQVMARMNPGESVARAQAESEALVRQAIVAYAPAKPYDPPRIVLDPGYRGLADLRREYSSPLGILMGMVGAVLLIACANIAGLLIVRANAREREIGMRIALGAGRWRVIRQLVTESVVLAVGGGSLGFALTYVIRHLLPVFVTEGSSTVELDMAVDMRILLFTAGTCLAAGLSCGLLPALRATNVDIASLIGRTLTGTPISASRRWTGKALVATQVAFSLVLLVGAGLFVRTLLNLRSEALGFKPDGLLIFRVNPSQSGSATAAWNDFYERAIERIAAVPGVRSVSISRYPVLAGGSTRDGIAVLKSESKPIGTSIHYVAPRYFETMGIPLRLGRDITWQDREQSGHVVVVNESLAHALFGTGQPIGQRLIHPNDKAADAMEIIGVCADAKFSDLRRPAPPTIYEPYVKQPQRLMTFAVRTAGDPEGLAGSIRDAVAAVDHSVPLFDFWSQQTQIDLSIRQERLFANLVSGFGLLALLLACLGIYGTLSYSVARRTPEIGLRMALGASRRDVIGLVLRESAGPVAVGVVVGVAGVVATARVIQSMLFGVTHYDMPTLLAALAVLVVSALLAAWLPSARASRVEPMVALRQE
jgi:predicted permease